MAGTRKDFGRVDALVALIALLSTSDLLANVQVADSWQGAMAQDECIYAGPIAGTLEPGPMKTGRQITDDDFIIPLHVEAGNTATNKDTMTARRRCEQLMSGIRITVADRANLAKLPGAMSATLDSADGPDVEGVTDPAGWLASGTVRVRVNIRMQ